MVIRETLTGLSELSTSPAWSWISMDTLFHFKAVASVRWKKKEGVLGENRCSLWKGESPFCHLLTSSFPPKHTPSQFTHACLVIVIQVAMVLYGKNKTPTCVCSTPGRRLLCFETFKDLGRGVCVCVQTEIGLDKANDQLLCQMLRRR